jgi:hypothetical protein
MAKRWKMQETSLIRPITFSKAGATIICPVCQKTATYQIGQLDREEWKMVRGKYRDKNCWALPVPHFGSLNNGTTDIDQLLAML